MTGLLALLDFERSEHDTVGIYWTKTGAFYSVARGVEAEAFLDGLPKGSSELSLRLGDQGGFFASARMGKDRALDLEAVVLATHGGPGEDGSLQAALDLAGVRYSGPTVAGAALGVDKLAFGSVVAADGLPTLPRVLLTAESDPPGFGGPYIVKP